VAFYPIKTVRGCSEKLMTTGSFNVRRHRHRSSARKDTGRETRTTWMHCCAESNTKAMLDDEIDAFDWILTISTKQQETKER
jgi:hypothetical protein